MEALRRLPSLLLAAVVGVFVPAAAAIADEYDVTPVPDWVVPVERRLPAAEIASGIDGGVQYLLVDSQLDLARSPRAYFVRIASMAINEAGVGSVAGIEIGFDPSYEQLHLHTLDVVRDGKIINKLGSAQLQVLQRESQLEAQLLDGRKTLSIVLDDVRVGDIVDYSYSLDGENPVFAGKISNTTQLQYGTPVARVHRRLRVPKALDLRMQAENTEVEPRISESGSLREYEWNLLDVAAAGGENATPGWFSPTAKVSWSEFQSWRDVVRWAQPMYSASPDPGEDVRREIARIAKAHATPQARLRAVLDFVQREVRYFGFENGPSSHAPNPPRLVFERRFGDCKDKTMLAVTMLDGLGIEARPAFVNTKTNRGVRDLLPTPKAFDHVLIHARVGDRTYWLDPTLAPQAGDLDHIVQADHGFALVIDPTQDDLVSMQGGDGERSRRRAQLVLDARSGFDQPVTLDITTTLEGSEADALRDSLTTVSQDDVAKHYLNLYASTYPNIAIAAPIEIEDDVAKNRLTTREHYRIDRIAERDEERKRHTVAIVSVDIDSYLKVPKTIVRKSPLAVAHPVDVEITTEVRLDDGWDLETSVKHVRDPAFEFAREVKFEKSKLRIVDRYKSLVDSIPADRVREYAGRMSDALGSTGYQLYWTDAAPAAIADNLELPPLNGWLIAFAALVLAASVWPAWQMFRYDPPAHELYLRSPPAPEGIAGWLILPAIGIAASPLVHIASLVNLAELAPAATWAELTSPDGAQYHWLWAPYAYGMTAAVLLLLMASAVLAVMFFQRRSSVPNLYVGLLVVAWVISLLDWGATAILLPDDVSTLAQSRGTAIRGFVNLLIWGSYFANSRRVAATFVRRRERPVTRQGVEPPPIPVIVPPPLPADGFDPPRAG